MTDSAKKRRPVGEKVPVKIFISHSSADVKLGQAITAMLKSALHLLAPEILLTTAPENGLEAAAVVSESLLEGIREAPVFLVLLTPASLNSHYVLYEMGARWFQGGAFIPVSVGNRPELRAPVEHRNVIDCGEKAQLLGLVERVAKELKRRPRPAKEFFGELEAVAEMAKESGSRILAPYDEMGMLCAKLKKKQKSGLVVEPIVRRAVTGSKIQDWASKNPTALMKAIEKHGVEEADEDDEDDVVMDVFWWLIVYGVFEYDQIDDLHVEGSDEWRGNVDLVELSARGVYLLNAMARGAL